MQGGLPRLLLDCSKFLGRPVVRSGPVGERSIFLREIALTAPAPALREVTEMSRPLEDSPYSFTVPPSVEAVPAARNRVVHRAKRLGLALGEELARDLRLLTGEVVANSVMHTKASCVVAVRWTGERLRVEVTDSDPNLVRPTQAGALDERGRGLLLVDALATEWGSQTCTAGKKTWFELAVPASAAGAVAVASLEFVTRPS
ncbi:ATP-binding protein [Streptomyces bluensis]|uniref:ATP-binding protein n=1 Tax=Streptomyces bluensis TaxID=33897 RepID=UPI00332CB812